MVMNLIFPFKSLSRSIVLHFSWQFCRYLQYLCMLFLYSYMTYTPNLRVCNLARHICHSSSNRTCGVVIANWFKLHALPICLNSFARRRNISMSTIWSYHVIVSLLRAGDMERYCETGRMIECRGTTTVIPSVLLPLYSIIGTFTLKGLSGEKGCWPCAPVLFLM